MNKKIAKLLFAAALISAVFFVLAAPSAMAADATATDYPSLVTALAQLQPGETLTIDGEIVLTDNMDLNSPQHEGITIVGINGGTLTGDPAWPVSGNSSNYSVVTIHSCDNITIRDMTFQNGGAHGLNFYICANVTLENVNLLNNDKAGMVVNGSTVTGYNLYVAGNVWGGINVDQGSGVTEITNLTLDADTSFDQLPGPDVWLDHPENPDITFTPVGVIYDEPAPGFFTKGALIEQPNPRTGDTTTQWTVYAAVLVGLLAIGFVVSRKKKNA